MNREALRKLIDDYSKPARRPAARPAPLAKTQNQPLTSSPKPARLQTSDMDWVIMPLQLKSFGSRQLQPPHEYKGLRIGQDPFIAIRADGPQGTSNHFYIYDLGTGEEVSRPHGTRADIYRWLKRAVKDRQERIEREQQQRVYETEKARKEEQQQRSNHEVNHDSGFYIMPFYSVPEINPGLEMSDDLYGEPEGDCFGPFHRDIENRSDDRRSVAEDWLGAGTLKDVEDFYWELFKKLPPMLDKPFVLIEAASRKDALAGQGHIWITDGLEKGPPVDPRQIDFRWALTWKNWP